MISLRFDRQPNEAAAASADPPDAGLTVLELMVVLVIMSLIGVAAGVQVTQQLDRAKVDIAKLQLRQLQSALALFQLDVRRYPTANEGIEALVTMPDSIENWRGPYLKNDDLLLDPWGQAITYGVEDEHFVVGSLGADRRGGGDGTSLDIVFTDTD